ncbi:regulator of microtubule dynamics protein 1-like [Microplitis mediator]|uniref:regulator of microtubule dynamics protein 1-like n=1 Tax=Microplitis mediator TaxID=375433 RepID=UPI0025549AA5|nr:regulator of microtubule dynamics protein 1-like [Microplitis mediator]
MSQFQNTQMITVALGATIGVIGAASLFIYQKIMEHREREQMLNNLENVNRRVSELQEALDNLRAQQEKLRVKKSKNSRKRKTSANSFYTTTNETDIENDGVSVTETDVDDEFYDCSDDEVANEELENGTAGVMLPLFDKLLGLDMKFELEIFYDEVLEELRSLALWHDDNIEVAWRLARAYFKNASLLTDTKEQDVILQEGIKSCQKFLDTDNVDLHKYYALLVGLRTEYLPTKEKLAAGKEFEKHVKLALKLSPDDALLNHLLGRFQYSVSNLTWFERKICETLFGEAPKATYEEAIKHLEHAENHVKVPEIPNKYFLAQAYLKTKSYGKAIELLKELKDLPACDSKEETMKSEAHNLISTYSSYC